MIGTKYTPELLAALAKTPHLRAMDIPATPNGQRVASAMQSSPLRRWTAARTVRLHPGPRSEEGHGVFSPGRAERSVDLPAASSVEFKAGVDAVCVIEEEYTGSDTITSFFGDETSGEPWLVIVEPD